MRLVACLVVLTLLAGCTEPGAKPTPTPTSSSSATLSAAPATAAPTSSPPTVAATNATSTNTTAPEGPQGDIVREQAPPPGPDPVIVAIIDTGIRIDHEAFAPGQVVAWHDFGQGGRAQVPTTTWDPDVEPYDDNGHGTAVASMVGGAIAGQTPSFAPGVKLAIAKANTGDEGFYWDDVAAAMEWAVEVVGADIVSMSVYAYGITPLPASTMLDALEEVRAAGVLPVVLAGNGNQNMGLPTWSWMHPPASSDAALIVGGDDGGTPVAPLGSMDPEVTAPYYVRAACRDSPSCVAPTAGTSFSTPLAAGFAASLIEAARAAGLDDPDADLLEATMKRSATDTAYPPNLEGYGILDADAHAGALAAILEGTAPRQDEAAPVNEAYVDGVQASARDAWSGRV